MSRDSQHVCQACGAATPKWAGKCPSCGAWNTLVEEPLVKSRSAGGRSRASLQVGERAGALALSDAMRDEAVRIPTGLKEIDRVLGGGLVEGSVVLLGGEPGVGKSTLLLQLVAQLSRSVSVLYATGEESAAQVAGRAKRLGVDDAAAVRLLAHGGDRRGRVGGAQA